MNYIVSILLIACCALPFHGRTAPGTESTSIRIAVLGNDGSDDAATQLAKQLRAEERQRGITINTSHVEYEIVNRRDRADWANTCVQNIPVDAAILVGSGGNLGDIVLAAQLARILGTPRLFITLTPDLFSKEAVDLLQKWLTYLGYSPDACVILQVQTKPPGVAGETGISTLLDNVLKTPPYAFELGAPFLMAIEDTQNINTKETGRGTVATGRIEAGVISRGEEVEIVGFNAEPITAFVTEVEIFRKILDRGEAGDNVGLLLRGIDKKDIRRGMVIVKPGSIKPHARMVAEVYILKKEEGGRHTPFHNKRTASISIRTAEVDSQVSFNDGTSGGEGLKTATVQLIVPVAMDKGLRFAIREGGRTVGAGQVTEILD